jgi:inner membrane protein
MTGRTHDLAAFTALSFIIATQPLSQMSLATGIVALSANMIGGLAPDIDQPTADLWRRIPLGTIAGKVLSPLLGGHRFISHSVAGIFLFGFLSRWSLDQMSHVLLVNMNIVWFCFMVGFLSHLVMDTFTKEGVPWLFPIPVRLGIPPFKFLRIKTGGLIEKSIIFPGLIVLNGYLYWSHYQTFLTFVKHYIN